MVIRTKQQLIDELAEAYHKIAELERSKTERESMETALENSEARWRTVVENAPDIIAAVDNDGTLLRVNRTMPGVALNQAVGMKLWDIMYPEDRKKATATLKEVFQSGESGSYEGRYIHPEGHLTWWETRIGPVTRDNQVVEAILITTDVTNRVYAEEALRRSEARWRTVVENAPDIITTVDSEGTLLSVNRTMPGVLLDQAIGKKLGDLMYPDDRDKAMAVLEKVFFGGEPGAYEGRYTHPDGHLTWWETHIGPIKRDDQVVEAILITTEITERVHTQEALRQSEARWRTLVENAPSLIFTVDRKGTVQYITHTVTGRAREQVIGTNIYEHIEPEHRDEAREAIEKVFNTGQSAAYKNRTIGYHGPDSWWEVQIGPIKEDDEVAEAVMIATDVTEREQAEVAIRESEELFRSIYADSPIAIMLFDASGKLIDMNQACLTMWGLSRTEDARWPGIFDPDPFSSRKAKTRLRSGELVRGEIQLDTEKAGEMGYYGGTRAGTVHLYTLASPLGMTEGGTPKGYVIQIQDITAIRQSEQSLRDFSRRLVDVQEAERLHLARELHDQIGQTLTGLRLVLEMAAMESGEKTRSRLDVAQVAIKDLMARVGDMSLNLRPSMLDDLGLLPSLLWHFEHYTSQTGIRVIFEHDRELERRFPPEIETTAYRIVQEALTNVARHSGVRTATVKLVTDSAELKVQIQDQGSGFDPRTALTGGAGGLLGMRERANAIGGKLVINSEHGRGTDLVAQLPLDGYTSNKSRQDDK